MRFLIEKTAESFDDILKARDYILSRDNIDYNKLNTYERNDFINEVIDSMKNNKILSQARLGIVESIKDSRWENDMFLSYLNNLPENGKVTDNIIRLMYELIKTDKIEQDDLTNFTLSEIYNRSESDALYTIKALAFVLNDKLQQNEAGENKYFDEPVKIEDLFIDGELASVDQIKDILDSRQTKDSDTSSSTKSSTSRGVSGVELLKKELAKQGIFDVDKHTVREWVKSIDKSDDNMKTLTSELIDKGGLDAEIGKVLEKNYTDNIMQQAIEKIKSELNAIIYDKIDKGIKRG